MVAAKDFTRTVEHHPPAGGQAPVSDAQCVSKSGGPLLPQRGFILIVVVGMLTVLVVLGLSYAEQGRVSLRGASNGRDLQALDALADAGFQFALRALHDDRNVRRSGDVPAHLAALGGAGWSSRWGFNPDPSLGGALPAGSDRAPSRTDGSNFQDSWRMLFWNEETVEPLAAWTGKAWGYGFKFRPGNDDQAKRSMETQRYPQPPSILLDTVQLQPFARVRKFRLRTGASFGLIQVGITPKDGGVNLNDVFDPGTIIEKPGIYETLPAGGHEGTKGLGLPWDVTANSARMAQVPCASPDRRTLEYILGKPPELAQKSKEPAHVNSGSSASLRQMMVGDSERDNGIYNWRHFFEPYGGLRAYGHSGGPGALWKYDYSSPAGSGWTKYRASTGFLTSATGGAPTTIWNVAGGDEPNRYGMEASRQILWTAMKGMSFTADGYYNKTGVGFLVDPSHYGSNESVDYLWFPTGLWRNDPRLPATNRESGHINYHGADQMFQGLGFDRFNPYRAGVGASLSSDIYYRGFFYMGAGAYGHPKAKTFQLHFMNSVAQGRFWTDLLAAWYFGGAPGYTNFLGATQGSGYNNWAHLGSSYDSLGIGSHWMPPTSHVWIPGFFNQGRLSSAGSYQTRGGNALTSLPGQDEVSRGMTRWPGNMPPARMAASYLVPMARWPADFVGQSNAHFCFNNFRLSVRAHGIQENWGDPANPGSTNANAAANRWYDAVDVNNTNFPVVYGLLSPEKMPSMLARTVVAPHLHWKARMLDVECRLMRPTKIDGSANPYDDLKNPWIPVQIGLRAPDSAKTYPGRDWDGDPDSGGYNPWIPLRMKLDNPDKPWNPQTGDPDYNVWVEPKLVHPGQPYDAMSNPFYNSSTFLDELKNDTNVRNDYIKYPWMPSLKDPVVVVGGTDHIKYGLHGWDDPAERTNMIAQGAGWSGYVQDTLGAEKFPYMPVKDYGDAPTWKDPGPYDGDGALYPNPGWDGYLFEPRWYTGRTVNPKVLGKKLQTKNGADATSIGEIAEFFAKPGQAAGGGGPSTAQTAKEPANAWDFATHKTDLQVAGGLGTLTHHRHVDPDRPRVVWGKMDFLTPEPLAYHDLNGDLLGFGTGRPADDVFTDCHMDRAMVQVNPDSNDLTYDVAMARPDSLRNWHQYFAQRRQTIPADPNAQDRTVAPFRPLTNDVGGALKWGSSPIRDGKVYLNRDTAGTPQYDPVYTGTSQIRRAVRAATCSRWDGTGYYSSTQAGMPEPDVRPHSVYGLPNPDTLQSFPGGPASQIWPDQFRRYFPVQLEEIDSAGDPYDDPDNNPETMGNNPYPGAMPNRAKLTDDPGLGGPARAHSAVNPAIPVPRTRVQDDATPPVPAVGKDEAWRITRIGPRYQEIIANEIMDYQLNPWWPNPCVAVSELCVPLDKQAYPSEVRAKNKLDPALNPKIAGRNRWRSYMEHMGTESNIGSRVPKYHAYFNRFWTRTNHKAVRNWSGDSNAAERPLGEPYRAITIKGSAASGIPDELINATEGKGMFPPTWQYFGQYPPAEATFQDRIKDFPYNAMEDQLGDDWRYLAKSVVLMTEPQMQKATGRNHPFRNWADFVAFLGHLVYRAPSDPMATPEFTAASPKALRDPLDGVDAWAACHGANADTRNRGQFFDGSRMRSGSGGTIYADALRSPIVAREGYWPIAGNYGRAPDASADPYYPNTPSAGAWSATEWKRRWDEIRGRDEAGLRIEHHYISERAANDVLVSLSNGRIGPIDFDGDGHVVMTRGDGSVIKPGLPLAKPNWWEPGPGEPAELPNAKPSGDLPQARYSDGWHSTGGQHTRQWQLMPGYPWHRRPDPDPAPEDLLVEFEDPEVVNIAFWDTDNDPKTMCPMNLDLGILRPPVVGSWRPALKKEIIRNCVTLPIKFHSNTFRVTVVVELTGAEYQEVFACRRYQKVFSRVPDSGGAAVPGTLTGEFIEHASRAMNGVDPELNWLGVR